jgi:hypothetical protein
MALFLDSLRREARLRLDWRLSSSTATRFWSRASRGSTTGGFGGWTMGGVAWGFRYTSNLSPEKLWKTRSNWTRQNGHDHFTSHQLSKHRKQKACMHGGVEFSTGVSRQIPHDPKSNLTFLSVILNEIPIKDLKNNNSQDRKIPKQ